MPRGRGYNGYRNNSRITKYKRRYYQKRKTTIPRYSLPELKFVDTELAGVSMGTAWAARNPTTVLCLNAIAQGDGPSNRDGRVYYIHSVQMKVLLFFAATESDIIPQDDQLARIVLVLDTQANETEIAAANVMSTVGGNDFLSFRNLDFGTRFRILKDKTAIIKRTWVNEGSPDLFASNQGLLRFDWTHTFKYPIKVVCNGTGSGIGDITNAALGVIAISLQNDMLLSYEARVRFSG